MNIQQEQTKALSHEYWRFVDRTTNGFGGNNEPTYFYGVFSTDGSLIIELTLLGDIVEEDDPRAVGCPQLGLSMNPINPMEITLDTFGGYNAGTQIFVVHISAFAQRKIHPYIKGMTGVYVIKTNPSAFRYRNSIQFRRQFIDSQYLILMSRFRVSEAIREQLYSTGGNGFRTTAKDINVCMEFWQYFFESLKPQVEKGLLKVKTSLGHRVKRIEYQYGVFKESIPQDFVELQFSELRELL